MAYKNDYDDLLRKIRSSGQNWSGYDLDLARKDPDAGMSIYTAKDSFAKARTDQEKLAANRSAEDIRQKYGGYSGGADGSGFTLSDRYAPPVEDYTSGYADRIDDLLDELMDREPFRYSPGSDPSYQAYSEQYRDLGRQAREDTLGSAAAMTGGQLSSYAMTAGQQAQNTYNARLSDKIPELERLAYDMYLGDLGQKRSDLAALQGLDDAEYGRSRDRRGDALANYQYNYQTGRDALADRRYAQEYADRRGDVAYGRDQDKALTLYQSAGDASGLARLWGMSPEQTQSLVDRYAKQEKMTEDRAARELADWYAQYGDFSRLGALGVALPSQSAPVQRTGVGQQGAGGAVRDVSELGEAAMTIANQMSRVDVQQKHGYFADAIEKALDAGAITEAEADFLVRALGY